MTGQEPRIVHNENITILVLIQGNGPNNLFYAQGHGPCLTGCAKGPLDQFLSAAVREHAGIVVCVPQKTGESGPGHRGIRLIHYRDQPPPQNLECDGVKFGFGVYAFNFFLHDGSS